MRCIAYVGTLVLHRIYPRRPRCGIGRAVVEIVVLVVHNGGGIWLGSERACGDGRTHEI